MRRHLAAALLLLLQAATPAAAQGDALRRHLESDLRREGCILTRYEVAYRGTLPGEPRPVTIALYGFESCGGGNNWASAFGVFVREGAGFRELPKPLRGGVVPHVADRVTVAEGRITVEGVSYGPGDPRCCPSVPRRASFVLRDGQVRPLP